MSQAFAAAIAFSDQSNHDKIRGVMNELAANPDDDLTCAYLGQHLIPDRLPEHK